MVRGRSFAQTILQLWRLGSQSHAPLALPHQWRPPIRPGMHTHTHTLRAAASLQSQARTHSCTSTTTSTITTANSTSSHVRRGIVLLNLESLHDVSRPCARPKCEAELVPPCGARLFLSARARTKRDFGRQQLGPTRR